MTGITTSSTEVLPTPKTMLEWALTLVMADEERRALPVCSQIMKNTNSLKILRECVAEATYKKLGYPLNTCYWWNDMKSWLCRRKNVSKSKL